MNKDSESTGMYSDAALESPANDLLGYQAFTNKVADQIHEDTPNEEFIVGIYGQWGSGKSTIVNFIEEELNEKPNHPTIIRFNPWWFSDDADLMEKYLSQLGASLEGYNKIDELRNKFAKFSRSISKFPLSSFGAPADKWAEGLADIAETEPANINELHNEISGHLADYEDDIVVIVDDIDRLPPAEIRHMFRVIKSVAAFPNITYIVAFDQSVVTEALEGYQGVSDGEEYLQKIIQLPLDVPQVKEGALHVFLSERLNQVLYQSDTLFEEPRWEGAYHDGVLPIIKTPRNAIRLSNSIRTTIRDIESEVNFVDLVCLEALRLFAKGIYDDIKTNRDIYTGKDKESSISSNHLNELSVDLNKEIIVLLSYLFPSVSNNYNVIRQNKFVKITDYYDRNRICDERNFRIYFRQALGEADLTESVFLEGIDATRYTDEFETFLRNQLEVKGPTGRSRAYNFMVELSSRYNECYSRLDVLIALLRIGDELVLEDPAHNRLDSGAEEFIVTTAGRLIAEEEKSDRFGFLESALEHCEAPYVMVSLIDRILQGEKFDTDSMNDDENLFAESQLRKLKQSACDRIYHAARSDSLYESPHLHKIINNWVCWDMGHRYETWFQDKCETAENIFDLIEGILETGQIYKTGRSQQIEYLDPEWLEPLITPEKAMDRITAVRLGAREQDLYNILEHGIELRNDKNKEPTSLQHWE